MCVFVKRSVYIARELLDKRSWMNLRHYPGIFLEIPRNSSKNLRIVGVPAEIRTRHLHNTSQKR
jgi:hypothetical protein